MNDTVEYEPAPCDDCSSWDYCADNYTACMDFAFYIHDGTLLTRNRTPYKSTYNSIYSSGEEF